MPRRLRRQHDSAVYHLYIRGVRRTEIFLSDDDREVFLTLLAGVVADCGWIVTAYCLMGNHYHLAVTTPRGNVARGMQSLNSCYAREFNRRHSFKGHLFESRYNDVAVESDDHLQILAAYIVLNPVRAGLCRTPMDWSWSSYRATMGVDDPLPFLAVDQLLELFGPDQATTTRELYRSFVYSRLEAAPEPS
jgi:putative transposase